MNRRDFLRKCLGFAALAFAGQAFSGGGREEEPPARRQVPQRVLGRTGEKVSVLGIGGAGMVSVCEDKDFVAGLLNAAIDEGITYFDTAHSYGKNGLGEKNFGLVMGTPRRKELFLAGKVEDRGYDGAMRQFEISLQRLGTDYLDLIQIHHVHTGDDVAAFGRRSGVYTALLKLKEQKAVRYVGVTGHPDYPQVKEALETYDFETFMVFVNPRKSSLPAFREQLPIALRKKMGIVAMKVYGGGDPATLVGDGEGKAPAAELLRFALTHPIAVAIPAISSHRHLRENLAIARAFTPMSDEEQQALVDKINPEIETAQDMGDIYPYFIS